MNDSATDRRRRAKPPLDFDDAPELTAEALARARPASEVHGPERAAKMKRGRPAKSADERKQQVTLRLSPDVLAALRADGEGWQTRLDELLRAWYVRPLGEEDVLVLADVSALDLAGTIEARVRAAGDKPLDKGVTLFERMSSLSRDARTGQFTEPAAKPAVRRKKPA